MKLKIILALVLGSFLVNSLTVFSNTLRVGVTAGGKDYDVTKYQAEQFMKIHPEINVEVVSLPQSSTDVLAYFLQMIQTKSSDLDVFPIDSVWLGELSSSLAEFADAEVKEYQKGMFKILIDECSINGKTVAVPLNATPSVLYYRKDILDKYNKKVPETWNELAEIAFYIQKEERKAGNKDFVGYVWQGKPYEGLTCNALEWIASNGGGLIVNDKKQVTIDNPKASEALKLAANWIGTISPKGVLTMDEESCRSAFQSGNSLFMRNWPYAYILCNQKGSAVKDKFDICPLPAGKHGKNSDVLGAGMIGVNKFSKKLEAAKKFVLFTATYEMQKYRTINTGAGSVLKKVYFDKDVLKTNSSFKKLYKIFPSAIMRPSTVTAPNYSKISELFYKSVYRIISTKSDADYELKHLAKEISEITGYKIKN